MAKHLIVTGGLFPQVVTETIFRLVLPDDGGEPFVPETVTCLVTGGAYEAFRTQLPSRFDQLWTDWGLPGAPPAVSVRAPEFDLSDGDDAGEHVQDLRSQREAELFADLVTSEVYRHTRCDDDVLHMSMAGGRKSMSGYAMAAMMIYGRPQDQLSHVLIEPQSLEGSADFWYPAPHPTMVATRQGPVDTATAKVVVIDEPFFRAVDHLPAALRAQPLKYRQVIDELNQLRAREKLTVTLHSSTGDVETCGKRIHLEPVAFALYRLLAERVTLDLPGAGPGGIGPQHRGWVSRRMLSHPSEFTPNPVRRYMEIYNDQKGARDLGYKGLSDARSETDGKNNLDHFNPVVSALKSLAKKATTNPLIAPQIFAFAGEKGSRRYGLGVSPDNITIID